jgi:glycosyl transferase family 25
MQISKKFSYLLLIILVLLCAYPKGYFVLGDPSTKLVQQPISQVEFTGTISYIINLDRSPERYRYVAPKVKLLGYDTVRISAVDGAKLPEEELHAKTDFNTYRIFLGHYPKRGTIGCSLSHFNAWKTFLDSDNEFAIIFEDDVDFDPQTLRNIVEKLQNNTALWDVVTFEISHRGTPLTLKHLDGTQNNLSVYLTETSHTGAYILNRKAAEKLMQKFFPIKMPVDHYMIRPWEFGLKYTGIEPRIMFQNYGDSSINLTASTHSQEADFSVVDYINHVLYKLQSYAIRFFYNLKVYLSCCASL